MKRKLIDLQEDTFSALNADAVGNGTNLKKYIEEMLERKAKCLEDDNACRYRLASDEEPSDRQLAVIMGCAAKSAAEKNAVSMENFYRQMRISVKGK